MDKTQQQPQCNLSILHFNDVYDIQVSANEPKGGAAYFKALLDQYRKYHTLTLFSGDAFSPALLSSLYKGQNMVRPLNSFKIDLACMGNHDLDYPFEQIKILKDQTNFPWLLSNIRDKLTGQKLFNSEQYKIINKNGYKIGIFSLAQKQWIDTLIPSYRDILKYISWQKFADYMVKQLKSQGCNIIIALTHMMRYNDVKLSEKFPQIDLILGGHDHLIIHEKVNHSIIVKSGTNFKYFSFIEIYPVKMKQKLTKGQIKSHEQKYIFSNEKIAVKITLVQVNHAKTQIQPDPQLHAYVQDIYSHFKQKQEKIGGYFLQDVDLRFKSIRKQQNGYLQFLASLYSHYTKSECVLVNGGNFRADTFIPAGPVTYGVLTWLTEDEIVVKKIPGDKLLLGLENCVSMYPNLSGRYSTFLGIQFTWDCSKKPFERILVQTLRINGKPVNLQKIYRVAMHKFASEGGDGFTTFKDCQIDHDHFHQSNLLLVNDLLLGSQKLLTGYSEKYPGRISYKMEESGEKVLVLNVPNPKNVKMIGQEVEGKKKQENQTAQQNEIAQNLKDRAGQVIQKVQTEQNINEKDLTRQNMEVKQNEIVVDSENQDIKRSLLKEKIQKMLQSEWIKN